MDRELIEPMEFFKVDKVADDVFVIGPNVVLKFNVSLSKVSNGTRYHYHKEYEYPTKGITGQPTLVTIKRSFDYYLSIENMQKDSNGNKVFIRIGPSEYMLLKKGLEEAISWFTNTDYKHLFAYDKGKLITVAPIPEFKIPSLPMNKYIEIYPIVIDKGIANSDKQPGVRLILGDDSAFIDINLDRLMGLYYTISCFNMYEAALLMINYIQRPEFGTNRFIMERSNQTNLINNAPAKKGTTGIEGRFVTPSGIKNNIDILEG